MRNNQSLKQQLRIIQGEHTPLDLIAPCQTRWNTQYYMLDRFMFLLEPLTELAKKDHPTFQKNFKELHTTVVQRLKIYLPVMEHLKRFTKQVEGDSITISKVPFLLHELVTIHLKLDETDSPLLAKIKIQVREKINTRLGWILQTVSIPLLGAALDPRYGNLRFISLNIRNEVWNQLADEGYDLIKEIPPRKGYPATSKGDIVYALKKLRKHFESVESTVSPLEYWSVYSDGAPLLPLVQMILAIPASSAAVERGFSSTGFIMNGRDTLSLDHVEQMAVVRNYINGPDYNFDDLYGELNAILEEES